jgi:hypothetical protein
VTTADNGVNDRRRGARASVPYTWLVLMMMTFAAFMHPEDVKAMTYCQIFFVFVNAAPVGN